MHAVQSQVGATVQREYLGADLLVESLVAAGATTLFGFPGDTGVAFYDALRKARNTIVHVLARDERHAVAMADAYSRVTNRVGFVEVSSGGGTTYAVGGLGEAFASGVPIVVVASDIHVDSRGTGALTEIDQTKLFSAVTKWSTVVEDAADLPSAVAEAVEVAMSGRPAPVVLIVPENVLDEKATSAPPPSRREFREIQRPRPAADQAAVTAFAAELSAARRPAILAGAGIHFSTAYAELAELAAKAGIVIATSIHGKGAVADSNPWSIGVVGNNGAREYANAYLREADVVLLVGTRANATDTNSWTGPARTGVAIAQIDVAADRAGRNFPTAIPLVGDAAVVLGQLVDQVQAIDDGERDRRAAEVADRRAAWWDAHESSTVARPGQLAPAEVLRLLNTELGDRTVVVADPGTPTPYVASFWEQSQPGRRTVIPRGHGPMGFAIPAAIGAAVACPGERIVSLTADGSFAMACGELETAARLDLPILYLQFTNNSLGWIKMLQHLYFERQYFAVDPGPIDAVQVARGCGVTASRIGSMHEFAAAIRDFVGNPRPVYLDMQVPHMIDVTPPVASWITAINHGTTRPVY